MLVDPLPLSHSFALPLPLIPWLDDKYDTLALGSIKITLYTSSKRICKFRLDFGYFHRHLKWNHKPIPHSPTARFLLHAPLRIVLLLFTIPFFDGLMKYYCELD